MADNQNNQPEPTAFVQKFSEFLNIETCMALIKAARHEIMGLEIDEAMIKCLALAGNECRIDQYKFSSKMGKDLFFDLFWRCNLVRTGQEPKEDKTVDKTEDPLGTYYRPTKIFYLLALQDAGVITFKPASEIVETSDEES